VVRLVVGPPHLILWLDEDVDVDVDVDEMALWENKIKKLRCDARSVIMGQRKG
jgi:hypothetical protein